MIWERKGLIFKASELSNWQMKSALQPTPILLKDRIRLYCGFRDGSGISRIGYVDINAENPDEVLDYSKTPVLDIGEDGCFDEFGVVPSVVFEENGRIFMYYAGYQLGKKVRFLVLGGLAISDDGGQTFERYKKTPVFERTEEELLFKVPHSILKEEETYRIWYGGGSNFVEGKTKTLPVYNIRYTESDSPYQVNHPGKVALDMDASEYRLGRPYVVKRNNRYEMYYGYSSDGNHYQLGFAYSNDNGNSWIRDDRQLNMPLSDKGWDSEMMAYPSLVSYKDRTYLFYNGNDYGAEGFGYAVLKN